MDRSSTELAEIAQNAEKARTIAVVNQSSGEIANSSDQVKTSADDLKGMATELNAIVGRFKAKSHPEKAGWPIPGRIQV
jgi:methyl-accepting chemotaxis protein